MIDRDELAARAMAAILQSGVFVTSGDEILVSTAAYRTADAMLRARGSEVIAPAACRAEGKCPRCGADEGEVCRFVRPETSTWRPMAAPPPSPVGAANPPVADAFGIAKK